MKLNLKTNTTIVYGRGILEKYSEELLSLGKKPLIVIGKKSSKNSQGVKDIIELYKEKNLEYCIFEKEGNEPSIEDLDKGANLGIEEKCDYVIGIGGGTVLDISKGIAILLKGKDISKKDKTPLALVPTLFGSGSETSKYANINLKEDNKYFLISAEPNMAIVDPYYGIKIDINIVKNASLNLLSNLIEGYLNVNIDKENEKIAIEGLRRLGESIDNILDGNVGSRDRENLSMASILGGILLDRYGRGMFQVLGETLAREEDMEVGIAKGYIYAEYLKKFRKDRKLDNIINVLGFSTFRDLGKTINKLSYKMGEPPRNINVENLAKKAMINISLGSNEVKNEIYYDIFNIYTNSIKNKELNYDII